VQVPKVLADVISQLDSRWGLDALWVFGSRATGNARVDSDWDLAALFQSRPDPVELFGSRGELELLSGVPIDIVDLDRASPVLARQVVKYGHLVLEQNRLRRINFVSHLPGRYEDVCIIRRKAEQALVERIRHG